MDCGALKITTFKRDKIEESPFFPWDFHFVKNDMRIGEDALFLHGFLFWDLKLGVMIILWICHWWIHQYPECHFQCVVPSPKTNSLPLKMDGWKTTSFLLGFGLFSRGWPIFYPWWLSKVPLAWQKSRRNENSALAKRSWGGTLGTNGRKPRIPVTTRMITFF